jgi:hypothetical protein
MTVNPDEIWVGHSSCMPWLDPVRWIEYFSEVEEILGASPTHLDENDPVRRRVQPGQAAESARYVVSMGPEENSRLVFGQVASIRARFSVSHYRNYRVPGFSNFVRWYFPARFAESATARDSRRSFRRRRHRGGHT